MSYRSVSAAVRLLGGEPAPIPAYASYFMNGVQGAVDDAEEALALGFNAIKSKVGYPDLSTDIEAVRAVHGVTGGRLAVTPTRYWLEYMDLAGPLLCEPLKVEDGCVIIYERAGNGIGWMKTPSASTR